MPIVQNTSQSTKGKKCLISRHILAALSRISETNLDGVLKQLRADGSFSKKRLESAAERARLLLRVAANVLQGETIRAAVQAEGLGMSSFYRDLGIFDRCGVAGLISDYKNVGRQFDPPSGNALAGWPVAESDLLAAGIAESFLMQRTAALKNIKGGGRKREAAVNSFFRCIEAEKKVLAWGIARMVMHEQPLSIETLIQTKGCPLALSQNLVSEFGKHNWKLMCRTAEKIRASKLF